MNKKIQKNIIDFLEEIGWLFEINNYQKFIVFKKEDFEEEDKYKYLADIEVRNDYKDMLINIYPKFLKENKEQQCRTLIHELSHTFTHESKTNAINLLNGKLVIEDKIRYDNERLTETISDLIFNLAQGNRKYVNGAIKKYLKEPVKTTKKKKKL